MGEPRHKRLSSLRVPPEIHRRVKVLAAKTGRTAANIASEMLEPAVAAEEQRLDRLQSRERPTRTPPPGK
jgi:predicted transcriptional regulator